VRLIVGFTPGGPADIFARLIGQWLSARFGQPFIIENRPGAGSTIGIEAVVNAPPDGYTLAVVSTSAAVSASFYQHLNFNLIRDIVPVSGITRVPLVMVVNPSVPAKTVPEFIAYAKANPGHIIMASVGNGTTPHMAGELFKMTTGIQLLHVPYHGAAPALTDLLGGRAQVMFEAIPTLVEHIRGGKLRALAVAAATRSLVFPDIPTVGEFLPGYEASVWFGVGAQADTPRGRRAAQQGDQCGPRGSSTQRAAPRIRWYSAHRHCGRVRGALCRRYREMGQGGSGGQHQGGLNQSRIVSGCEFWPSPAQGHSRRTDTPDEFVACPLYLQ
jgi:tripartite-type tricarboxylate transporter receptor subunit TctC